MRPESFKRTKFLIMEIENLSFCSGAGQDCILHSETFFKFIKHIK